MMLLFEVIRWGNASEDLVTGGPDGPDTCYLVRANSIEEASTLIDRELRFLRSEFVPAWAGAIYLIGTDASARTEAKILRGPYVEHAYRHGWRHWYREGPDEAWVEQTEP
jgi:hypothetical protein